MKNFKEKTKTFFHKYVVLRLKNKKFVLAWLTVMFAEICAFNKITVTTDMVWMDLFGIAWAIITNPVQMLTLLGTTIVSFVNPLTRGIGDNEFEENPDENAKINGSQITVQTTVIQTPEGFTYPPIKPDLKPKEPLQ